MSLALSREAETFLGQVQFIDVAAIRRDPSIIPADAGIYGWWFDATLQEISAGCHVKNGLRLLYIGIAPSGTPKYSVKMRTLRDRLLNHCRGPMATSTLRRTLAAILKESRKISQFDDRHPANRRCRRKMRRS